MKAETEAAEVRKFVAQTGTFSMGLVSGRQWYYDEKSKLPVHEKVLRPLLEAASECWAYGLTERSAVFKAAKGILTRVKGKYRVALEGDPISGHELFWNAQGGQRGTIVILIPRAKFDAKRIFSHCKDVWSFDNFLTGHSPAAIRFARESVIASDSVAVCLPRNNGIEWMDVYVNPKRVQKLYDIAIKVCS